MEKNSLGFIFTHVHGFVNGVKVAENRKNKDVNKLGPFKRKAPC